MTEGVYTSGRRVHLVPPELLAAIAIQAVARGYWGRKLAVRVRRDHVKAWCSTLTTRFVLETHWQWLIPHWQDTVRKWPHFQACAEEELSRYSVLSELPAAVAIQSMARGFLGRKTAGRARLAAAQKEADAAVVIDGNRTLDKLRNTSGWGHQAQEHL